MQSLPVKINLFTSISVSDPIGILRASWANLLAGRVIQGGSTLTQQTSELLFEHRPNMERIVGQTRHWRHWMPCVWKLATVKEIFLNSIPISSMCMEQGKDWRLQPVTISTKTSQT